MGDSRPEIASAMRAFGLPAVVTRPAPDNTPIQVTGFWTSPLVESDAFGQQRARVQPRKVFVIARAQINDVPRGTFIDAAEYQGGPIVTWQVDGLNDAAEPDHLRLTVSRKN